MDGEFEAMKAGSFAGGPLNYKLVHESVKRLFQILLKKINRPAPGQFGSGFVITGSSIVMKAVVYVVVNKGLVFFAIRF